ncbi:MAG: ABC transporter substrate-binding protein [Clostridiales bacterium]|nr:ABC transporter substrate-binding protein [Clostridiales bacterium]
MKKILCTLLVLAMALTGMVALAEDTVLVGVSCMETGPMAAGGLHMKQAITMAFEEINAAGGVLGGKTLEMYLVDDTGNAAGAVTAVNNILSQDVSVCIGPHTSPMALAAMEYYKEAGIPFVTAATSPSLVDQNNEYFFRMSVSDASVGKVMVKFAAETFGAKKIATIHIANDYGKAANNSSKTYAESIGLEYYSEGMTAEDTDLTGQLLKIKDWGPDVMFSFNHDADSALVIRQFNELGMKDIPFVGSNALPMPQTLDLISGEQVNGMYASTDFFADATDPVMADFMARYEQRWGVLPERYAAMYYTASHLIADAINRAGSPDPAAIRDALAATEGFESMLGKLTANEHGELNSTLFILQIDADKVCSVAQKVSLN